MWNHDTTGHRAMIDCHSSQELICDMFVAMTSPYHYQIRHFSAKTKKISDENISISFWLHTKKNNCQLQIGVNDSKCVCSVLSLATRWLRWYIFKMVHKQFHMSGKNHKFFYSEVKSLSFVFLLLLVFHLSLRVYTCMDLRYTRHTHILTRVQFDNLEAVRILYKGARFS